MPYDETPFEQQLHEDVAARRTPPTAQTIRIGSGSDRNDAAPPSAATSAPSPILSPAPLADTVSAAPNNAAPKERMPLPVIIAVAMALGAVCVVGGSLVMRRLVPDTKPAFTANNSIASSGNVIMAPELGAEAKPNPVIEETQSENEIEVLVEELPPVTVEKPSETTSAPPLKQAPAAPANEETNGRTSTYVAPDYQLTPPGGFALRQSGRRTIWRHENGAQILVETGKTGDGSPRSGWVRLERDLKKRYGKRYKSLGIRDGEFAGLPAAIWEFELTGKDGITRRKIDIGIQRGNRGYALLGSAPKDKFDAVFPQINEAISSFRLKDSGNKETPKPSVAAEKSADKPTENSRRQSTEKPMRQPDVYPPEPDKAIDRLPEPEPTAERGY